MLVSFVLTICISTLVEFTLTMLFVAVTAGCCSFLGSCASMVLLCWTLQLKRHPAWPAVQSAWSCALRE
jgi:hypothetical protein